MNTLAGYKTYIIAGLVGVLKAAQVLGYVDQHTFDTASGFLMAGGLASLRMAVATLNQQSGPNQPMQKQ